MANKLAENKPVNLLQVIHVRSEEDAADVRILVGEYIEWLKQRYPDDRDTVETYFKAQGLDTQLRDLLAIFRPPKADCLLARLNGDAAGVVMLKSHSEESCEMNRMFVRPSSRGHGIGKALVAELLDTARKLGYRRMLLAAGPQHHEATALYRNFGFIEDKSLPDTGAGELEVRMVKYLTASTQT